MKKIFKYQLPVQDLFSIMLPAGSEILCVQTQYNVPCIWVKVYPYIEKREKRKFRLAGTGHELECPEKNLKYIGTFQLGEGSFVGHLFEILE